MKKLIICLTSFVILFSACAVGITFVLINKNQEPPEEIINENNKSEKTLDLNGLYNENDLELLVKKETYNEKEIDIPYISGLKNKDIENKINNEMHDEVYKKVYEYGDKLEGIHIYTEGAANFSNVFSIEGYVSLNGDDYDFIFLNYELINGNKLTLDDVLVKNADIKSMVRASIYRDLVMAEDFGHYDEESDKWVEDVVSIDEDELLKKVESFMNDEKDFYFTSKNLMLAQKNGEYTKYNYNEETMEYDETKAKGVLINYIPMEKYATEITIYDKFLTNEDLYEKHDIGSKNIYPCSKDRNVDYTTYGFASDNLWIKLYITDNSILNRQSSDVKAFINILKENFEAQRREYIDMANSNPNMMFVIQKAYRISPCTAYDYETNTYKDTKIMFVSETEDIIKTESNDFKKSLEENLRLLSRNSYYDAIWYFEDEDGINRETKEDSYSINTDNMKKIEDVSELFYEGTNYMDVIKEALRPVYHYYAGDGYYTYRLNEEIDEILERAEYEIRESLNVISNDDSVFKSISYDEFGDSFKMWK